MLTMITDNSTIHGALAVLGMLGVLLLGIESLVQSPPPTSTVVENLKKDHPVRIFTRRGLWNR